MRMRIIKNKSIYTPLLGKRRRGFIGISSKAISSFHSKKNRTTEQQHMKKRLLLLLLLFPSTIPLCHLHYCWWKTIKTVGKKKKLGMKKRMSEVSLLCFAVLLALTKQHIFISFSTLNPDLDCVFACSGKPEPVECM